MVMTAALTALILLFAGSPDSGNLPGRYFHIMLSGVARVEERLANEPDSTLQSLESQPGWRHFPSAILAAAVLYSRPHDANVRRRDPRLLAVALRIGDLLAAEHSRGAYTSRLDHHRDTYMWLEAYRLLEAELGADRRERWKRALTGLIGRLAADVDERKEFPAYRAPYLITSPNHYALWSSTVLLGARVFGNAEWERLARGVLHRFAAEERSADGFWGENSSTGPTTGYDYVTSTAVALYWELSRDPAALAALRKSTAFHENYTYPDGTPVETINDRNRYWGPSMWGHFGFSHFPDGRRYAEFLTGFYRDDAPDLESLGRIAQNALYYHPGKTAPIPQDKTNYVNRMYIPAGIRKTGPWVACYSGIIDTPVVNHYFLDRQGHFSVFHEKTGLIITGANSKRQPELATFSEKVGDRIFTLPISSRLEMSESLDKLSLAYNSFFAELEAAPPSPTRFGFRFRIHRTNESSERRLTLQLILKPGQTLETAAGRKIILDQKPIDLSSAELGAWIKHNGWTLRVPPSARLIWPVYPFNPYADGPETDIRRAVGALSVPLTTTPRRTPGAGFFPLSAEVAEIPFTIEVD